MTQLLRSPSFRLVAILWLFGYLLVDILAAARGRSLPGTILLSNAPLYFIALILTMVLVSLVNAPWRWPRFVKWSVLFVAVLLSSLIHTFVDILYLRWLSLQFLPFWQTWALSLDFSRIAAVFILYTWTFVLALALVWASRANDVAKLSEARAAASETATLRAEANALRLQLNPHFLFNTLNSISSLTLSGQNSRADTMIGLLAEFLRSSLLSEPTAKIALEDEIDMIMAYLRIEEARFGDRLSVEIDLEDDVRNTLVPNFILQPLAENAVKYGLAVSNTAAEIVISAKSTGSQVVVSISNYGTGSLLPMDSVRTSSHGLGLSNVRQRLGYAYGTAAQLITERLENGYRATIVLPFSQK